MNGLSRIILAVKHPFNPCRPCSIISPSPNRLQWAFTRKNLHNNHTCNHLHQKYLYFRPVLQPSHFQTFKRPTPSYVQYMYNTCTIFVRLPIVQVLYNYCTYIVQRTVLVRPKPLHLPSAKRPRFSPKIATNNLRQNPLPTKKQNKPIQTLFCFFSKRFNIIYPSQSNNRK